MKKGKRVEEKVKVHKNKDQFDQQDDVLEENVFSKSCLEFKTRVTPKIDPYPKSYKEHPEGQGPFQ